MGREKLAKARKPGFSQHETGRLAARNGRLSPFLAFQTSILPEKFPQIPLRAGDWCSGLLARAAFPAPRKKFLRVRTRAVSAAKALRI